MIEAESWNYFFEDTGYAAALADRLRDGVEMDSAIGLAAVLQQNLQGDQRLLDFGSGPGHYLPVLRRLYTNGSLSYRGIDILLLFSQGGGRRAGRIVGRTGRTVHVAFSASVVEEERSVAARR